MSDNLNNAIKGTSTKENNRRNFKTASDVPAIRNNGGGHLITLFSGKFLLQEVAKSL